VNAGLIPLGVAAIGASYAALVLKSSRRRDNVVFGVLALTDAAMTAWRGINVMTGASIVSDGVLMPCTFGTTILAMITLELVSAFPRRPAMSWRWRTAMLAWGAAGFAILTISGLTGHGPMFAELGYFVPTTLLVFAVCARAYRLTHERAARIVIDVGLHTTDMTFDQAVKILTDEAHLEKPLALSEVKRYTLTPTQPLSYLVGRQMIFKMRERYRQREGAMFKLKKFHTDVLTRSTVPPSLMAREIFGN